MGLVDPDCSVVLMVRPEPPRGELVRPGVALPVLLAEPELLSLLGGAVALDPVHSVDLA